MTSYYDDETKALIAAADKARADFEEIDHRWKDIERDIKYVWRLLPSTATNMQLTLLFRDV